MSQDVSSDPSATRAERLVSLALETTAGPALVVDDQLRIVAHTPGVEQVLEATIACGTLAPDLLCGGGDRRPIAHALAQGRAARSEIIRATGASNQVLSVRTTPLLDESQTVGHVLHLTALGQERDGVSTAHGIVTKSDNMRELLRQIEQVAPSDANVLVRGETGSGKELVARAVHSCSQRARGPFSAINCAALPEQLLESELFGHVRGAFTGAVRDHEGTFRRTNGGTLFLDEVAELPLSVQAKLLRAIQERTVLPVGGRDPIPVDVRIVAATHRSLRAEVAAGRFRADLMYRLRVIPIFLPPLRDRRADVAPLCQLFLDRLNEQSRDRRVEHVAPDALHALSAHDWPGNVRELQNVIEYAFWLGQSAWLSKSDLPPELQQPRPRGPEHDSQKTRQAQEAELVPSGVGAAPGSLSQAAAVPIAQTDAAEAGSDPVLALTGEARRVAVALRTHGGNRERAAKSLGVSRSTLWRRMKEFGLDDESRFGRW